MKAITTYKHRVFGLDVVRAVAILLILCSHSTILLFPNSEATGLRFIQFFGTIGVDIFFDKLEAYISMEMPSRFFLQPTIRVIKRAHQICSADHDSKIDDEHHFYNHKSTL